MEQISLSWGRERRTYTVTGLNAAIGAMLEAEFSDVWVAGEVSGVRLAASGHFYFTLKDRDSQVRCVCFKSTARFLKCKPQDGLAVLARGRIDVYEPRGEYQLLVEAIQPEGHGALQFAFEQLKEKLAAEGLFDAARKRPLPKFPRRIGIVTSPAGAVIRDMLNILARRFPGLHIRLYPAQVQGVGSIEQICAGLKYFSSSGWAEVVILARGGGSLEDLWTFNEETVARAIAASEVPVISAVGHETDFTIADFVADLRAPTPSAAAELVVATREQLLEQVAACFWKLRQAIRYRLAQAARRVHLLATDRASALLHRGIGRSLQRVDDLEHRLRDRVQVLAGRDRRRWQELDLRLKRTDLRLRFARSHTRLGSAQVAAAQAIERRLRHARLRLEPASAKLAQLSPLTILNRGYAIVLDQSGQIVKDTTTVELDSQLAIRLARGRLAARVTGKSA